MIISEEENELIQSFWTRNYGKEIPINWHRLYQSYNGNFNEKYFPEIIYSLKLEPKLNSRIMSNLLSDKSFLDIFFKDIKNVKTPELYLINNSGYIYTGKRELTSEHEALEMMRNKGEVVVKKSLGSSSGDDVWLCNFANGIDTISNKKIRDIFLFFEDNFIVQEKLDSSHKLKQIYPNSVNTIRIVTYIMNDKIFHSPITLRMGRGGNNVDNLHSGGIAIHVFDDGSLAELAFTENQESFNKHPDTNVLFKGIKFSFIPEIIKLSKEMHNKTPHMGIISWDFTVDENDEIVLLEMNLSGQSVWFPQMLSGNSMFGDNTSYMAKIAGNKKIKKRKTL